MKTNEDFMDRVLLPAFNDNDAVSSVDEQFGSLEAGSLLIEVGDSDGDVWQVTICRKLWTPAAVTSAETGDEQP